MLFDEVRPIGVTNVPSALLIAGIALIVSVGILHRLARGTPTQIAPAAPGGPVVRWLKGLVSSEWILTLVQMPDGRASLSAFQILLWTLVVAVSAMYVMALSGNLINLTPGTLTLLGIAGAAGLIAAAKDAASNQTDTPAPTEPTKAGPDGAIGAGATGATGSDMTGATGSGMAGATGSDMTGATGAGATGAIARSAVIVGAPRTGSIPARRPGDPPQWRDLILDPADGSPDIGRAQMLLFTVVSAAFVVVQVLNYYVIPDIPTGYQILIGISNGVYVGRKVSK